MKPYPIISLILFVITLGLGLPTQIWSQSEEDYDASSETDSATDLGENIFDEEDFTGTLSEEDPDNEELQKQTELFGTDEAGEQENAEPLPTHLLTLNFEGHVVISDRETGIAKVEIFYNLDFEQETEIKETRSRATGPVEITTHVVGSLAGNDLFSCSLDVSGLSDVEAESMTLYTVVSETAELPEQTNLAVQVKFVKKLEEDWFADCLSGDYAMKTQGDPEEFLYKIWEGIVPDPDGIAIENYDIYGTEQVDLISELLIIDDEDTGDLYEVSGQGELTVEPL